MKFKVFLCTLVFSMALGIQAKTCKSDDNLTKAGFDVHSRSFHWHVVKAKQFYGNGTDFVSDLNGVIYSSVAKTMVRVEGFDYLKTPQDLMYGDVYFLYEHETDKLIEVRWYNNGKKHVAYDSSFQPCATNVVPWAVNTLF